MIKLFLKAKHWQLFLLLFVIPFLLNIAFVIRMVLSFQMGDPNQLNILFRNIWPAYMLILIAMGTLYAWFWSIAIGLNDKIPPSVTLKTKWFRIAFFFTILYFISYMAFFYNVLSREFQYIQYFSYILPIHFIAMFCLLYLIYFVAKTFKTIELQREVRFSDFIAEFFLFWFNFVGVWVLQPKINQITEGTFPYNKNSNTPEEAFVENSSDNDVTDNDIKEYSYIVVENISTGRRERITPEWWKETTEKYGVDKFTVLHYLDANGNIINKEDKKRAAVRPPKSYLAQSILVTVFCCMPLGIVGIVNAANVESRFYAGDIEGAKRASREAKKWSDIGLWIGIVGIILYFVTVFTVAIFSIKNGAK